MLSASGERTSPAGAATRERALQAVLGQSGMRDEFAQLGPGLLSPQHLKRQPKRAFLLAACRQGREARLE